MDWVNTLNKVLSEDEMKVNASNFYNGLCVARGWTKQAVAGMLGNIQVESTINPNVWQGFVVHSEDTALGFGFTQWSPAKKIRDWLRENGYSVDSGDGQLERIVKEMEDGLGGQYFINKNRLYPISRTDYIHSTNEPYWLASAFMYNYERPSAISVANSENDRRKYAQDWYSYLVELESGEKPPIPPDPPTPPMGEAYEVLPCWMITRSAVRFNRRRLIR